MYTLNTTEVHAVCYGISAYDSNAMKSSNPHSGIYEASTSRTLDLNCCNPSCNQGGVAVVIANPTETICYAPEVNHCSGYREDNVSATLQTGYHYGGGVTRS